MKNIFTIIKKEFSRFFKDKRMVVTILLPGLLIYLIYSLMGTFVNDMINGDGNEKYTAYVVQMPEDAQISGTLAFILDIKEYESAEKAKADVENGNLDLLIIFPENLDEVLSGKAGTVPNIGVYYNSSVNSSYQGYLTVVSVLENFKKPLFSVNAGIQADLVGEKEFAGKMLATIMPMIMFALLVSGCVSVAPEAIAGEKERGTMATMLITPIKRWQLALGKILSLTCFALLSGLSSFIGVILSLPKLTAGISGDMAAYYSVGHYFMLFGLIISVVLVIISAFSVMSAFAKSVKEAGTLIAPLMIIVILLGLASMFTTAPALGLYAIPLLGSALAMSAVFTFSITPLAFLLSVLSNLVVAAALVVGLSFMFKSEKIMFNK